MTVRIHNWSHEQVWEPAALHHPRDDEEVAALVRRAAAAGTRLKAIGSGLSWSDAAAPVAEALRLDRMDRVVALDRDGRRVRVQGGARLDRMNEVLAAAGLALENFGSIVTQTVAGYLGTASHGTGIRTSSLSARVAGLRLVDGRGDIREIGPGAEPDLFEAARAHLGCLGVVTEVTLDCGDAFDLEERLELTEVDTVLGGLGSLLAANDYLKLWWLPPSDRFVVYRFNRTGDPRTRPGLKGWFDRNGLSGLTFGALAGVVRALPALAPFIMRTVQRASFGPHRRVDRSDLIIPYAGSIPRHQETEYAVPIERAAEALGAVHRMVSAARDYRVNFPLEVRFVAADDVPLSPACGRDVCFIGAYVASRRWAPAYFAEFEALIRDFDGRPHWGKTFTRTAADLRRLYPALERFDALRRRCDPAGVFRNPFVDRVFGLGPD